MSYVWRERLLKLMEMTVLKHVMQSKAQKLVTGSGKEKDC